GISLSILLLSSCGDGAGTGSFILPFTSAKPSASPSVAVAENPSNTNPGATPNAPKTFKEPITEDKSPSPLVQVQSYEKMMRALKDGDFEYINKEFSAGGLKLAATRAEGEFKDYPITLNINSVTSNMGLFGLASKNVTAANQQDKVAVVEKTLQNIVIYSIRSTINKLIENNKMGLTDDQYTTDVSKALTIYFYGNPGAVATEFSLAKLAQKVDADTVQKTNKSFDTLLSGIGLALSKPKDINDLLLAKTQIDLGFLKMLYMSSLNELSEAVLTRDLSNVTESEYLYLGIKNMLKASNNTETFAVESVFLNPLSGINYPRFQKSLDVGILERAQEELKLGLEKISKDNKAAQNHALAAKLYVDIINCNY
ncbi:MAG: hypothetical protein ACK4IX_16745, partial [Candidatus Sericytochromatia bacterium]